MGGSGRANVGLGSGVHPDVPRGCGCQRPDQKGERRPPTQKDNQTDQHDRNEYAQDTVFSAHEDHRAFVDGRGNIGDFTGTDGIGADQAVDPERREQTNYSQGERD